MKREQGEKSTQTKKRKTKQCKCRWLAHAVEGHVCVAHAVRAVPRKGFFECSDGPACSTSRCLSFLPFTRSVLAFFYMSIPLLEQAFGAESGLDRYLEGITSSARITIGIAHCMIGCFFTWHVVDMTCRSRRSVVKMLRDIIKRKRDSRGLGARNKWKILRLKELYAELFGEATAKYAGYKKLVSEMVEFFSQTWFGLRVYSREGMPIWLLWVWLTILMVQGVASPILLTMKKPLLRVQAPTYIDMVTDFFYATVPWYILLPI